MKTRGFEVVSSYIGKGIVLPVRQTAASAGYDLAAAEAKHLSPQGITLVPTGVKAYMAHDEYLAIFIRSSLAIRRGISLINSTGIIDADYYNNPANEGHIIVALYNNSQETMIIEKGERIAQGIFNKYPTSDLDQNNNKHRSGGIESTGK